jgi:hypothetical protein
MHTAREAFLSSPERAEFEKMVTTPSFEIACRAALLAYIEEQHHFEKDPNDACAAHHRIIGARHILAVLGTIHLKIEPPKPYKPPQLTPPK